MGQLQPESTIARYNFDAAEPSEDKLGSEGCSDDEFNNNPKSDEDVGRPSSAKRKRPVLFNNGPKQKKRKHHFEQSSVRQYILHATNSIDTIPNHTFLLIRV